MAKTITQDFRVPEDCRVPAKKQTPAESRIGGTMPHAKKAEPSLKLVPKKPRWQAGEDFTGNTLLTQEKASSQRMMSWFESLQIEGGTKEGAEKQISVLDANSYLPGA